MVLAVDEKPQLQALARTQRGLPVTAGHAVTPTHDYRRHGTLSLFAGLDIHTGKVYYACQARHRHQEFLAFRRQRARRFPTPTVHLVLDHDAIHKHQKVPAWRDAHPRFHFHFIPTYSSWLNRVEHVFSAFQRQVRGAGLFCREEDAAGRNRPLCAQPQPTPPTSTLAGHGRLDSRPTGTYPQNLRDCALA